jgi:hypothetical protein
VLSSVRGHTVSYMTWYRVVRKRNRKEIGYKVSHLGIETFDHTLSGEYNQDNPMPDIIEQKLAVLEQLDANDGIEGVGKKIESGIWWIQIF